MKLYGGIDLHSNNQLLALLDEQDKLVYQRRLPNDLEVVLAELMPYQSALEGLVVESTFNGYWLVDGLMDAGYQVHLANTAAIKQYEGLKHTDDPYDARWLAHLLRLGILPEGYIYPRQERPLRDLARKRSQLVRQRTTQVLSMQNLAVRNTGSKPTGNRIKQWTEEDVDELLEHPELALAVKTNLRVRHCLDEQIEVLEGRILEQAKLRPAFKPLLSVYGIGRILALTVMLEAGDISRFEKVGNFASYCRCVDSKKLSNGKRKGSGNTKNGNKYLAWAFVEAANFAVRYYPQVKRYYQRKRAKTNGAVAIKAVAHKLARACYYVVRDQVSFDVNKAFA